MYLYIIYIVNKLCIFPIEEGIGPVNWLLYKYLYKKIKY